MKPYLDEIGANLSCPAELGRIVRELVTGGALASHFNSLLRTLAASKREGLSRVTANGILLHAEDRFALQMRRLGRSLDEMHGRLGTDRFIHTPGAHSTMILVGHGLAVRRYALIEGTTAHLKDLGISRYHGEALHETPADTVLLDFPAEAGAGWMVRVTHGPYAHESRYFRRDTLEQAFATAVQGEDSSLVTLCQVFGAARDRDALPYLCGLAANDAHFVRWAAIQATARIDGGEAHTMLTRALTDEHPQIRRAATRGLQKVAAHG